MRTSNGTSGSEVAEIDIKKTRDSHVGYLLLSDEEIRREVKNSIGTAIALGDLLVFGSEDWKTYFNIELTENQLKKLPKFPWDKKILESPCPFYPGKSIQETHFAFLGLDVVNGKKVNILQLKRGLFPNYKVNLRMANYSSYYIPGYCRKSLKFKWYLMLKNLELSQEAITFTAAKEAMPQEYEAAITVEEIFKRVLLSCKYQEISNPVLVDDKVVDASNLTVRMIAKNKITISQSVYQYKAKRDSYGYVLRTRAEKSSNLPISVSRKLNK